MSPDSSRSTHSKARTPVRPPLSRIFTVCSRGGAGGGPAASNFSRRVHMARYLAAMSGLIFACCRRVFTRSLSRRCSSSQRRRSSSKRSNRALRASW